MNPIENRSQSATKRLGGTMITLAWLLALALLTLIFNDWLESQRNPNPRLTSSGTEQGPAEVRLARNRYGHYVATGRINGHEVEVLLDTGATDVSIPGALAKRFGLKPGAAVAAHTANGIIEVYLTTVPQIALGSIVIEDVAAHINPHISGDAVLLGMSFLKHLEFTQRGDTLTLRQTQ
ncbi:MAG: retropepsin-like aspartic protease family protein [Gammaproteobacteria bacterium]